ncbi:Putative AMP-dependent synthetase/ligase, phosphopantetheine binding ACP domain, AMP-binding protein [Septoria linicola]|uniref:AMP-dependent synthetase/ligase, phosphopantetheine binding ACP domain, AMP-binding protein n=1 Tax=Septoria linicola TaxID=215465 RepID=A0A9Q9B3T0_9PEZI|nr:putative AMP-dependent synthetase/ligase, phosphopantetheine binding ACP domain, AMP-binding protein [Septoria linicola]USW56877.1 Putative AMP-dependent synthetase/ligase, phosphopantetheine binding ACP domain, AMP-binding protein [Septoria linicola]
MASSRTLLEDSRILIGEAPLQVAPPPPAGVYTLPDLFQHQAKSQPGNIAFSCQTEHGVKQVTYVEADAIAASLAIQIQSLHIYHPSHSTRAPTVAIWLEKGLDLILSILATTYSGATWLPLDPDVPVERVAVCCVDSSATAIICDSAHLDRARDVQQRVGPAIQVRTFEELSAQANEASNTGSIQLSGPSPRDAAYLIYTSGTTGTPKGIAIPHSAALTFSLSEREVLQTGPSDIVWNGFSPAFDMFIEEMWVTIAGRGHLAIGTRDECRDAISLPEVWKRRGVSVVNAVPTLISIMVVSQVGAGESLLPSCIRLINLGGEACPPALVERLARPGLRIINTYGPTETTVTCTWAELQPGVPVTIGRPLPSYHACFLPIQEDGAPASSQPLELSAGIEGELAIGGPCVGLGYVGREELTAQKFISHPLFPGTYERLYRTGDRVRLQADMNIAFLGRIDTQVKYRGFRIELGEIESVISDHSDVQTAAVILANANTDMARLEAFVVLQFQAQRDTSSILQICSQRLPSYMRPDEVHFLEADEVPRLPSGKINGKALHELSARLKAEAALAASLQSKGAALAMTVELDTSSPLGLLLLHLSALFPQAGPIKPEADFFDDLGGHSLLAAMLVSRLRSARSEVDSSMPYASIGLPDIYEGRTAAAISARYTSSCTDTASSMTMDDDLLDDTPGTGPQTGEHVPISQQRWILCGIAQIVPLLFLLFIGSIEILVPYLVFDFLVLRGDIGWGILAAYAVFVAIPPFLTLIAVVGKWLVLGKAKEGEYPLYGSYYFRWWLAERFTGLANVKILADSAMYPLLLRALGAKVGQHCHLGAMAIGAACDLVEIGDDVVVGADVVLAVSVVERGMLILKKVSIGSDAIIGSNSVIEGGAIIEEAAEVGALSMVPDGMRVPTYQRFHGSPARFERAVKEELAALGKASRPSAARATAMLIGNVLIATLAIPLLYLIPQLPGLLLFDVVDLRSVGAWGQVAVLSLPIAFCYQFLIFFQLIVVRHLFLGRLREGTYKVHSAWYLRKWFIDRLMDLALDILHPVFASLYIVPFLQALGVKIGSRSEVSTARGLSFELLEIGDEAFVADSVLLGDSEVRGNELTLKKTKLESRAFAGNASLLPQGTVLASETLVGVLSIAPSPEKPLTSGTSCFGSPPVLMPSRHKVSGHADNVLFNPSVARISARLLIEGLRIVIPRAVIIFGLGFALQLAYEEYSRIGAVYTLLMLPAFYLAFFALPSLILVALLKWILIGRYTDAEWPLWSLKVWLSEAVTSTWETTAEPLLAGFLVGTPYLAWCFRLMGVKIGSRVTLLASDITEYDCVSIGDEAMVNQRCGAQTHLFEDRVMKVGRVTLGARSCVKPYSIFLPGSSVADGAQLGCLSLLMKGEQLPENTAWEGAPVVPRAKRRRAGPHQRVESSHEPKRSASSSAATSRLGTTMAATPASSIRASERCDS